MESATSFLRMKRDPTRPHSFMDVKALMLLAALVLAALAIWDASLLGFVNSRNAFRPVDPGMRLAPAEDITDGRLCLLGRAVDINQASLEELVMVPGIGVKSAENILSFRQDMGFIIDDSELLAPFGPLVPRQWMGLRKCFRAAFD